MSATDDRRDVMTVVAQTRAALDVFEARLDEFSAVLDELEAEARHQRAESKKGWL